MAPAPVDIPSFATDQLSLLSAELAAETASTADLLASTSPAALSRAGLAILNLNVSSQRTGLGGKTVLELEQDHAIGNAGEIGEHSIRTGDIVRVGQQPKGNEKKKEKSSLEGKGVDGVVVRVNQQSLQVALDNQEDDIEGFGGRLWVVKLANEVTYKRMNQIMEKLRDMEERDRTTLTRVLFGLESPTQVSKNAAEVEAAIGKIEFYDPTLNDSQKEAVKFALASRELALIHGPPGTGKTYTIIELILQMVNHKLRILVCGPSNIAVDNIVERLAPHKLPIIRLGHPARLLPTVLDHSLDVLTRMSDAAEIVKDIRTEMDAKQASIKKTRNGRERRAIYQDMRELRKEFRQREKQCVTTLVGGSKVVLTTLHGAGGFQLRQEQFDVVIIDEASQALEAQCWIPLLFAKKVVLAGDHLQLPPTVKSSHDKSTAEQVKGKAENAKKEKPSSSLEITLFDRLLSLHGSSIKRMLTTQYRMHEKIMRFPSDEMYGSKLVAAESVKARLLTDLPYEVRSTDDTLEPLVFYDTQGGDFTEKTEAESADKLKKSTVLSDSKSNEMEAALVKMHVQNLIDAGTLPDDIAVVTPYNAQLTLLAHNLKEKYPAIELGSVDGFQGREKEAVIVSLVRSNPQHEVGFLAEKRRLNVMNGYQAHTSENHSISPALEFFLEQAIPASILYDEALDAYHRVGQEVQETRAQVMDLAIAVRAIASTADEDLSDLKAVQETGHIVREHRDTVQKLEALQREQVELWVDVSS
ncbi:MAG: hypothetical protein Q9191_002209 [Dirinaria sp. TL-2023a]